MTNKNQFNKGKKLEYDLVCGMKVDPLECEESLRTLSYKEKNYYFCSPFCKAAFSEEPELYLARNLRAEGDKDKEENII